MATIAQLAEKMARLGRVNYTVKKGGEGIAMLYLSGHLICSVEHALSLSLEDLGALIEETLAFHGEDG